MIKKGYTRALKRIKGIPLDLITLVTRGLSLDRISSVGRNHLTEDFSVTNYRNSIKSDGIGKDVVVDIEE